MTPHAWMHAVWFIVGVLVGSMAALVASVCRQCESEEEQAKPSTHNKREMRLM